MTGGGRKEIYASPRRYKRDLHEKVFIPSLYSFDRVFRYITYAIFSFLSRLLRLLLCLLPALPLLARLALSARLSYTVICTFDYGTLGERRHNSSVESTRRDWNERRQLRISRKIKGQYLYAENTRVSASSFRSFLACHARLYFSSLRGRQNVSR